jgi:aspartyl-tRNA(Asn)/glutamyl-tRNA(Gln) amidotransferase subunit A
VKSLLGLNATVLFDMKTVCQQTSYQGTQAMSHDLHYLTIAEASERIAVKQLSPVELTRAFLERIEALNDKLHAFLTVTADLAMQQARAAEQEILSNGPRSPMHGIPFALKDIYDTAGIATTGHSRLTRDRVPEANAACTERLLQAGGILLGKLATHEFATGGPSYDLPWPPANNPWLLDRFPGGSSSGAGAAVAAGLAPCAMGSDTGGSVRLPAAFCGLAGLKPTFGRVSKRGVLPLAWSLDNCGPLTWTVEDCAIMLQVIAGYDALDPSSADRPVPNYRAGIEDGVSGMRIGLVRHFYEGNASADPAMIDAMHAAVQVLQDLGADVIDVELPSLEQFQACNRIITMCEAFAIHEHDMVHRPQDYGAVTRYRVLPGAMLSAADYLAALRQQRECTEQTLAVLNTVDVLLTATTYGPAPVQATMRAEANFARPPLTNPFNLTQLPAISICNGYSEEGLPLAMQIAGRRFDEATCFKVARAYEKVTPWRQRRPEFIEPQRKTEGVDPRAASRASDAAAMRDTDYAAISRRLDLRLDDAQLRDLVEAMPHVEAMLGRLRRDRPYTEEPSLIFRHADSDAAEVKNND